MAKTREYVLYSDTKMANPNGDLINDNRPRQDERTGRLEMSDVRIKRYVRDEMADQGHNVFVMPTKSKKKGFLDCKGIAKKVGEEHNVKEDELEGLLKKDFADVKLFGAVVTKPKFNITGPLQIIWSQSIHEAEVKFAQGTSVMASNEGAEQGTIWSKYLTPFSLFRTYMIYNDQVAKRQNIPVEEEDLEIFKSALIDGMKNYKSTSKNHMPRLLIEVIYKNQYIDGELDFVETKAEKEDLDIRDISDFTFDLSPLVNYVERKKEVIEKVNIYSHPKVQLINSGERFEQYTI
ncbi:type I-B CRISPR-associated protein Cas7/Csh2 [Isachenkonia alkalipeptolytica]|uniref:Type I-B CRISPR-associated protein Cas7/Csh2 n=1 Tax=Isachenkonia alkalipeptolytica TaxID=2565777 RepID=A0AA43XIC2_9CLOT|nr:type I-B CRISPR-associated protein Cas7/Csh2 [Isachenkonia alkalipeptolytica]NBG87370.1 type I-B CRISPR-associated protein Cas7/Csh2 [Isachenkonia alkalipeptolytica]